MRKRVVHVSGFVLVLLTLLAMPAGQVNAGSTPPDCYNPRTDQTVPATKWLDTPGTLVGTNKADVLVGSTGGDVIKGLGGNDIICSAPDGESDSGGTDVISGGAGDDTIYGIAIADGGTGSDYIELFWTGSSASGGPGNDYIFVNNGKADGGSGNDVIVGNYAQSLLGGSGSDWVGNDVGDPLMDCGSGTDRFAPEGATTVRRCEKEVDICDFYDFGILSINSVQSSDVSIQC